MCSKIVTKPRQCIIKVESHILSIDKVQSIAPVHFSIVRRHQIKKRHHIWLLLASVVTDLEKVLSRKWRCPPQEAFHWQRGDSSADSAIRPTVQCGMGVSPARESLVLRVKRQTHNFWNQQKQAHIDYQAHLKSNKVKAERIKTYNDIP